MSHCLNEGIPTPRCWLAGRCQNKSKNPGAKCLARFEQGAGVAGTVGVALYLTQEMNCLGAANFSARYLLILCHFADMIPVKKLATEGLCVRFVNELKRKQDQGNERE